MTKPCSCGSGQERRELIDAAGLFCTFVCDRCEQEKRSKFNPRIFNEWYDPDQSDVNYPEPGPDDDA